MNYSEWVQKQIISQIQSLLISKTASVVKTAQHTLLSFTSTVSTSCQLCFPNSPFHFLNLKTNNSNLKVSRSKGGNSINDGYLSSYQLTLRAMKVKQYTEELFL